jgi:hypothetical protein
MNIKLSKEHFEEILNNESRKIVGTILKRFEIIEDKNILKKDVKELIYESYRNLRDIIENVSKGNQDVNLIFDKKSMEGDNHGK